MMASRRENRFWFASLIALPFLLAADFMIDSWRDIDDYLQKTELRLVQDSGEASYAGARWTLAQVRLIGDGRDTKVQLPNGMRLVVVRLSARAEEEIGQSWMLCNLTLADDRGRRWQHLDFITSSDLSRELDPSAPPMDNCDGVSRNPPVKGDTATMEEKFVVPAEAAPSLAVRLSFLHTRPDALSIPLGLK